MTDDSAVDIVVPQAGTETEGTVEQIQVALGDKVTASQIVVVVEMDKAAMEVPSPIDGVVSEIVASEGDEVMPGEVLLRVTPG